MIAHVCLILEGTYPYVAGGVSSCVHQLITMLPKTNFTLVYIGAESGQALTPKYKLPPNVVGMQEIFLFDKIHPSEVAARELKGREIASFARLQKAIHSDRRHAPLSREELATFKDALLHIFPSHAKRRIFASLLSSSLWEQFRKEYEALGKTLPVVDFFHTWRSAHLPIYRILSQSYPRAEIYHSLCTGYAGLAATAASIEHNAPLFVTEHGIYAHERAIELAEADWFYSGPKSLEEDVTDLLRRWWMDIFYNMSRITYSFASEVITLYEGNRQRQLSDGAPPSRTRVIPNGINLAFQGLRRKHPVWNGEGKFRLGFVGRVVAIKDIKTLIKSVRAIYEEYPDIECRVVGPTDEEPDYYEQCRELCGVLEVDGIIKWAGKQEAAAVYQELDCLLLTSISEAQPLVVLEANSAGIPVVATDVGACRDLLEGREEADRRLGASGLLAPLADYESVARAVLKLIRFPEIWEQMSQIGMERVANFYEERELVDRYDVLYRGNMSRSVRRLPWQG